MKTITSGMFWHIHHGVLCEWTNDIQERIDYIRKEKPANEIKTRLKLMKPVKGELPDKFVKALKARKKAWEAYDKAWEARNKALEAHNKAREAHNKAWEDYVKTWEAYDKAREAFRPQLEALHKKECKCKEWNGTEMIFKKGEKK